MNAQEPTSTRPYLIRAIHEWCTDNGLTPYLAVRVDNAVQVPREYVNDGEIVLNVSYDATGGMQLGNEYIEFKARFGGKPREIMVPVSRVMAIYARESGQGMSFPMEELGQEPDSPALSEPVDTDAPEDRLSAVPEAPAVGLSVVPSGDEDNADDKPRGPSGGGRPTLKLVK